jgi:hypothetical protein
LSNTIPVLQQWRHEYFKGQICLLSIKRRGDEGSEERRRQQRIQIKWSRERKESEVEEEEMEEQEVESFGSGKGESGGEVRR